MTDSPDSAEKSPTARGEDTRRRLIAAAYTLFLEHGYHGTSMRAIAQAAGLAVGGIYNHFHSKEAIFAEVLDQYHPYHAIVPALLSAHGDRLEDFLRHLTRLIHAAIRDQRDRLLPLIYIEVIEFRGRHIQALAARILPAFTPVLQKFVDRQPELRAVPLPIVQRAYLGMLVGYYFTEFMLHSTPILAHTEFDWSEGMLDVFLHGILKDPA
jgi:AcrR family transcriptional regulator